MNSLTLPLQTPTYIKPKVEIAEDTVENNEAVIVFIVLAVILLGFGYGVYCTMKGGSFEFVVRLSRLYFRIGCDMS